jgi:hypothetical protein
MEPVKDLAVPNLRRVQKHNAIDDMASSSLKFYQKNPIFKSETNGF